jgi:hypothetical protein
MHLRLVPGPLVYTDTILERTEVLEEIATTERPRDGEQTT